MANHPSPNRPKKFHHLIFGGAVLCAIIALGLVLASMFMIRANPMDFRNGLSLYRYGVTAGLVGVGIGFIALTLSVLSKNAVRIAVSVLVVAICASIFWAGTAFKSKAGAVPRIHDITTDTENPPLFQKIVSLRESTSSNPIEYGGSEIAQQQLAAYPDIQPLLLSEPLNEVFQRSVSAVKDLGWEIVNQDEANGIIEATDTTAFFGFKDDVVIRLQKIENQIRLDIRSLSRVGLSDVGANADRIRKFFKTLKTSASASSTNGPTKTQQP